jgi:hypothetical protein
VRTKNKAVKTDEGGISNKDWAKDHLPGLIRKKTIMGSGLLETLMDPGYPSESMDWQLKRSKRKKKRRQVRPE